MTKEYDNKIIKVPRFEESAGFYTTKQRSKIMSKIGAKNTKPELVFRKALYAHNVRYRVHHKKLPGKPDISNVSKKFVVFIDGEFWHGHNWKEKKARIKSNRDFWIPKIERNMQRDREVNEQLKSMGFRIFRFWESELKKDLDGCVKRVSEYIMSL